MLKGKLGVALALLLVGCMVCGCAPKHTHVYEKSAEQLPTCTKAGFTEYLCSCGESYRETLEPLGHSLDGEGMCSVCGYGGSEGLAYEWEDGGWTVAGPAAYGEERLAVAAKHESQPVVKIAPSAFAHNASIREIALAEGLEEIGNDAFAYTGAEKVRLPDSLKRVGSNAFLSCTALAEVTLGEGTERLDAYAFAYCTALGGVELPASVRYVGNFAFYQCWSLEEMIVPNGVAFVGDLAFAGCRDLTSVFLPASLETLGSYVFSECPSLREVRFGGTEEQWNALGAELPAGVALACGAEG